MRMLTIALAICLCAPALAEAPAPKPAHDADICLAAHHVDHTVVVDGRTILFYMNDRTIWKNTLKRECPSLGFERAFTQEIVGDRICSNRQLIQVMNTGTRCALGAFAPYTPQAAE